jgi:hypothetical protein
VGDGPEEYEVNNAEEESTDEREPAHYVEEKKTRKARKNRESLYVKFSSRKGRSHSRQPSGEGFEGGRGRSRHICPTLGLRNAEIEPIMGGKLTIACARANYGRMEAVVGWS